MDEILELIEICVDAHAPHLFLYFKQWDIVRQFCDDWNEEWIGPAEYKQYKFSRGASVRVIDVHEVLPNGYEKFRLLIVHDYSEYTKER